MEIWFEYDMPNFNNFEYIFFLKIVFAFKLDLDDASVYIFSRWYMKNISNNVIDKEIWIWKDVKELAIYEPTRSEII